MKMTSWMQGQHGTDRLSNFLVGVGFVLIVLSMIPGLDLLSWVSFVVLAYALFRCFSKKIDACNRENAAFERVATTPKRRFKLMNKAYENRKTTRYFTCKGCGQTLSVSR